MSAHRGIRASRAEADEVIGRVPRPAAASPEISAWASSLSAGALSTIQGGQDAQSLVTTIREGCAPADALLEGLRAIAAAGNEDRLRGACREIQKALERRA